MFVPISLSIDGEIIGFSLNLTAEYKIFIMIYSFYFIYRDFTMFKAFIISVLLAPISGFPGNC